MRDAEAAWTAAEIKGDIAAPNRILADEFVNYNEDGRQGDLRIMDVWIRRRCCRQVRYHLSSIAPVRAGPELNQSARRDES